MTTFQLTVADVANLAAGGALSIAGPKPVVVVPPTPPAPILPVVGPGVIYADGKMLWPGDWDGSSLKADYSNTTQIPGMTVAAMTSIAPWAYWLPYVLHLKTSQFVNLVLKIRLAVAKQKISVGAYTSVLNPDGTWKTDVITGGIPDLTPYLVGTPDSNGISTFVVQTSALAAANIDLYKIIVQDQSGLTGDVWDVAYAAFV